MTAPLILASASPARTKLLTDAGIAHTVHVSDADEDALAAAAGPMTPAGTALLLARAKAESVAAHYASSGRAANGRAANGKAGAFVLGCDSVFELDGVAYGKPWEPAVARERWLLMRGRTGVLHTGHWLIGAAGAHGELTSAAVTFEDVTDAEIDAYVATGEPLQVAGAFTIDGLAGAFITGVDGDPHTVVGLSISALRRLFAKSGVSIMEFWA